jgi:hypothetical protein
VFVRPSRPSSVATWRWNIGSESFKIHMHCNICTSGPYCCWQWSWNVTQQ